MGVTHGKHRCYSLEQSAFHPNLESTLLKIPNSICQTGGAIRNNPLFCAETGDASLSEHKNIPLNNQDMCSSGEEHEDMYEDEYKQDNRITSEKPETCQTINAQVWKPTNLNTGEDRSFSMYEKNTNVGQCAIVPVPAPRARTSSTTSGKKNETGVKITVQWDDKCDGGVDKIQSTVQDDRPRSESISLNNARRYSRQSTSSIEQHGQYTKPYNRTGLQGSAAIKLEDTTEYKQAEVSIRNGVLYSSVINLNLDDSHVEQRINDNNPVITFIKDDITLLTLKLPNEDVHEHWYNTLRHLGYEKFNDQFFSESSMTLYVPDSSIISESENLENKQTSPSNFIENQQNIFTSKSDNIISKKDAATETIQVVKNSTTKNDELREKQHSTNEKQPITAISSGNSTKVPIKPIANHPHSHLTRSGGSERRCSAEKETQTKKGSTKLINGHMNRTESDWSIAALDSNNEKLSKMRINRLKRVTAMLEQLASLEYYYLASETNTVTSNDNVLKSSIPPRFEPLNKPKQNNKEIGKDNSNKRSKLGPRKFSQNVNAILALNSNNEWSGLDANQETDTDRISLMSNSDDEQPENEEALWARVKARIAERRQHFQRLEKISVVPRIFNGTNNNQTDTKTMTNTPIAPLLMHKMLPTLDHRDAHQDSTVSRDHNGDALRCWSGRYIEQSAEQEVLKKMTLPRLMHHQFIETARQLNSRPRKLISKQKQNEDASRTIGHRPQQVALQNDKQLESISHSERYDVFDDIPGSPEIYNESKIETSVVNNGQYGKHPNNRQNFRTKEPDHCTVHDSSSESEDKFETSTTPLVEAPKVSLPFGPGITDMKSNQSSLSLSSEEHSNDEYSDIFICTGVGDVLANDDMNLKKIWSRVDSQPNSIELKRCTSITDINNLGAFIY